MIAEHAETLIVVGETDRQTVTCETRRAVICRSVATIPLDSHDEDWALAS